MEKIKNKFVVLAYVLLLVGMLFYIDVTVVKKVEKKLEDAESEIECLNIQILDLKRKNSKLLKVNDSLLNINPYIVGKVSWYGGDFHGKLMANGKIYDKYKFTAASPLIKGTKRPKYKLGTKLLLINPENGKSIEVVITDTGGFRKYGRELDLSYGAFKALGDPDLGTIMIEIEIINNKI